MSWVKLIKSKIVKVKNKYQVQSEKGKNLGTYDTKQEAEKRLKQVEYFKHKSAEDEISYATPFRVEFYSPYNEDLDLRDNSRWNYMGYSFDIIIEGNKTDKQFIEEIGKKAIQRWYQVKILKEHARTHSKYRTYLWVAKDIDDEEDINTQCPNLFKNKIYGLIQYGKRK